MLDIRSSKITLVKTFNRDSAVTSLSLSLRERTHVAAGMDDGFVFIFNVPPSLPSPVVIHEHARCTALLVSG
jgi:hypothetical protein